MLRERNASMADRSLSSFTGELLLLATAAAAFATFAARRLGRRWVPMPKGGQESGPGLVTGHGCGGSERGGSSGLRRWFGSNGGRVCGVRRRARREQSNIV